MTVYRIYILDGDERVEGKLEDFFDTDRAALERAEDARGGQYAAEVWEGERLVGRTGHEFCI